MIKPRELYLEREKEDKARQFKEIIDNPDLSILQLWELYPENYDAWCRKYYYPQLLSFFKENLFEFNEWMNHYDLTDEFLMEYGISRCISPKKFSKDYNLYLTKVNHKLYPQTFIAYKKNLKAQSFLGYPVHYTTIKEFSSYSDWCSINPQILNITLRSAPNSKMEQVFLDGKFELLKMGGIDLPIKGWFIHRSKPLEFVNLCGLTIRGKIYSGEQMSLECSYCAVDHLICENLDYALPTFEYCSMEDISISDSKIQQWSFYNCKIRGELLKTDLYLVNFWGGIINLLFKDCHIRKVSASEISESKSSYMSTIYRSLKKIYSSQGDDKEGVEYFIKEKEIERKNAKLIKSMALLISYMYWGYGRKPIRIVINSILIIFGFALLYFTLPTAFIHYTNTNSTLNFWDSLYASFVTFTTLGFTNISIDGISKIFVGIESFIGAVSMGFLVAGFSNFKY